MILDRRVDDTEPMALPRGESDVSILAKTCNRMHVCSVNEHVVGRWRAVKLCKLDQVIGRLVVIVAKGEHAEIDIIGQRCWPVDLDGSDNTVGILSRKVRVVPGRAVLGSQERVQPATTVGRNRALCRAVGAIVDNGAKLADTVPMDGCATTRYM